MRSYLLALAVAALAGTCAVASCNDDLKQLLVRPVEALAVGYGINNGPTFCDTFTDLSVSLQGLAGPLELSDAVYFFTEVMGMDNMNATRYDGGTWEMQISEGNLELTLMHDRPDQPVYSEWPLPSGTEFVLSLVRRTD